MAINNYTDDQINKLKEAIGLGVLMVEYADKKVTYRSINEMIRTLNFMLNSNAIANGECADDGKRYAQFDKGL